MQLIVIKIATHTACGARIWFTNAIGISTAGQRTRSVIRIYSGSFRLSNLLSLSQRPLGVEAGKWPADRPVKRANNCPYCGSMSQCGPIINRPDRSPICHPTHTRELHNIPVSGRNLDATPLQPDGTWTAPVLDVYPAQDFTLLTLALPALLDQGVTCGCYLLARCGAVTDEERWNHWDIYGRRPLYAVSRVMASAPGELEKWRFVIPAAEDPGYRWLAGRRPGDQVNVIGPLGVPWSAPSARKNLLLTAPAAMLPALLPAAEQVLNRGGRVAASIRTQSDVAELRRLLPWSIELTVARTHAQWQEQIVAALPWADTILAVITVAETQPLADALRLKRFRLAEEDAYALVLSDLLCGYGACLACVIPTRSGGNTRACLHGPIFPLVALAT